MTVKRMDHVGVIVADLEAAIAFFIELGLELDGKASLEGPWVDRVIGLEGVRSDIAMMRTPDGRQRLELSRFNTPEARAGNPRAPVNTLGTSHLSFLVEGIDDVLDRLRARGAELVGELEQHENIYRLCYIRGPEGILIELAEDIR